MVVSGRAMKLLLCLAAATTAAASTAATPTTLIHSSGSINKSAPPIPATSSGGVIAVLTSPGTDDVFNVGVQSPDAGVVSATQSGEAIVVTSPGATLGGGSSSTSSIARGHGASAASVVAGSVVLTGVTSSDIEVGLADTRHGRTLTGLFLTRLRFDKGGEKKLLVIAVQGAAGDDISEGAIKAEVGTIFEAAAASAEEQGVGIDDLFELEVVSVRDDDDASRVMGMASAAAPRSSLASTGGSVSSALAEAYSKIAPPSSVGAADPPSVAEAILSCDDAYARHARYARAKVSAWKSRSMRGLIVDKFGTNADAMLKRTMDLYDRDTMAAAGTAAAAPYRLELRSKLQARVEKAIRELFSLQVANLEKTTLKKFTSTLLRKHDKREAGTQDFYNDNAEALRAAAFAFDTSAGELEIPSLALSTAKSSQEMNGKLNSALIGFPDSPAAQLKTMKEVKKTASKKKKPTERSIDAGIDLVAMIRPDGFGTLQGFAGYQLGGSSITVGVHNDADAPEVISQFGGVRPPFIRVQPKLRLDVEL